MKWLEDKIQQAIEDGLFDNLPGQGQPLRRRYRNPLEDPTMRLANEIMSDNDVVPAWIGDRQEIKAKIAAARQHLARAWAWHQEAHQRAPHEADRYWQRALTIFRTELKILNKRIFDFNLGVPVTSQQLAQLDEGREIKRVTGGE